jgi:hypothetical protein
MMPLRIGPWHVAICLILLCFGAVSGLYYYRIRSTSSVEDLLSRFPRGASTLAYLDLAALRNAGVLQALTKSDSPVEAEYSDFVRDSGFDYTKDLDAMMASFQKDETFFLLRGRFNWGKLMDLVIERGGDCYNGFCRTKTGRPNRWISFFAITPSIMAMAVSRDAWAVDSMLNEKQVEPFEQLPRAPVWLSVSGSELSQMNRLPPGTKAFVSALSAARRITIALDASGAAYQATLQVDCGNEQQALDLQKQLQAVTALLQKMIRLEKKTPNPRDLSGVLAAGRFHSKGPRVEGTWPVQRELLEAVSAGPL